MQLRRARARSHGMPKAIWPRSAKAWATTRWRLAKARSLARSASTVHPIFEGHPGSVSSALRGSVGEVRRKAVAPGARAPSQRLVHVRSDLGRAGPPPKGRSRPAAAPIAMTPIAPTRNTSAPATGAGRAVAASRPGGKDPAEATRPAAKAPALGLAAQKGSEVDASAGWPGGFLTAGHGSTARRRRKTVDGRRVTTATACRDHRRWSATMAIANRDDH